MDEKFKVWATTSFGGCDGGNPSGKTWLCGIEWGGGETPEQLEEYLYKDFVEGEIPSAVHFDGSVPDALRYPSYNLRAAKLLALLAGKNTMEKEAVKKWYRDERIFSRESDYFKLNLYPISFKDTNGDRWNFSDLTGFKDKTKYIEWCHSTRFQFFRDKVETYKPQIIICTGIEYAEEFRLAFGQDREKFQVVSVGEKPTEKQIKYFRTNQGKTLVAVTYFFGGRFGLNSDAKLRATGEKLKEMLEIGG